MRIDDDLATALQELCRPYMQRTKIPEAAKQFFSPEVFEKLVAFLAKDITDDSVEGGPDEIGSDEWYRAQAKEQYESEGTLEIDENALISRGWDPGAYVEAWVWVENPEDGEEAVLSE
jgi:hypothetical protein